MTHIPYKGTAQAMNDVVAGQCRSCSPISRRRCRMLKAAGCARSASRPRRASPACRTSRRSPRPACRASTRWRGSMLVAPAGNAAAERGRQAAWRAQGHRGRARVAASRSSISATSRSISPPPDELQALRQVGDRALGQGGDAGRPGRVGMTISCVIARSAQRDEAISAASHAQATGDCFASLAMTRALDGL